MPRELSCAKCAKVDTKSMKPVKYILVATFHGDTGIENCYVVKTLTDLTEFRKNVLHLASQNTSPSNHLLPDMNVKEKKVFGRTDKEQIDKNKSAVDEFFLHMMKLPKNILSDESVVDFFSRASAKDEDGALKLYKEKDLSMSKKPKGKSNAVPSPTTSVPPPQTASAGNYAPYEEVTDFPSNGCKIRVDPVSEYSEIKTDTPHPLRPGENSSGYAEVGPLPAASLPNKPAVVRQDIGESLYAQPMRDREPKQQPFGQSQSPPNLKYEDASPVGDVQDLYEDASSTTFTPALPKQRVVNTNVAAEEKAKSASASSLSSAAATVPLTPIPPMPQFASPTLVTTDTNINDPSADSGDGWEIQVVSISDYDSTSDNVLSFRKGTLATLLVQSDSNWWCIRLGTAHGWVPASYWRMLNNGECASLITKANSPWFVGELNRQECEVLLLEHGKQQHFVVRESDSGHYALSIKYNDRIHHFPIKLTADRKYNIGKHDFKALNNIILYYKKNALFHDEQGQEVTLGSPLVIIRQ